MNPLQKRGQKSKLEKLLTRSQSNQLFRWLTKEELSYKAAAVRLQERFRIKANLTNLHGFYHGICLPRLVKEKAITPDSGVLLDVVIKRRKDHSVQVQILQRNRSVALFGSKSIKCLQRSN